MQGYADAELSFHLEAVSPAAGIICLITDQKGNGKCVFTLQVSCIS